MSGMNAPLPVGSRVWWGSLAMPLNEGVVVESPYVKLFMGSASELWVTSVVEPEREAYSIPMNWVRKWQYVGDDLGLVFQKMQILKLKEAEDHLMQAIACLKQVQNACNQYLDDPSEIGSGMDE